MKKAASNCEYCINYVYDDYFECYVCDINLDEDEMVRFMQGNFESCPYYRNNDDYKLAQKQ